MKHAFLVTVDSDLTAEDIKSLICNDVGISRLSMDRNKVGVTEMMLEPYSPSPEVIIENLSAQGRYSFSDERLIRW